MDKIKLINHSSIYISNQNENIGILTDPWYDGYAFNKSWSLLYKNEIEEIKTLLKKINYIFISHEHPDHFSIKFFIDYEEEIKNYNIKILFQETKDKRVENFLNKKGFQVNILKNDNTFELSKNFKITLYKQGFVDSSFLLETGDFYHLNINDCEFIDKELNLIKKKIVNKNKKVIIYIQFSYAAFRPNEKWFQEAASYKLERIKKISQLFESHLVVPFASFIFFCHSENFYMNKFANNCKKSSLYLKKHNINYCFLNPSNNLVDLNELLKNETELKYLNNESIDFWDKKFSNLELLEYEVEPTSIESDNIKNFLERIRKKNNIYLLFILRYLSFKFFFGDIIIGINKTNKLYLVNFFQIKEIDNQKNIAQIIMSSDQFNFMLKEPFGFDTVLISGRLKVNNLKSFTKLASTIGFIVINTSNYGIRIRDLFDKFIFNKVQDTIVKLLMKKS